MILLLSMDTRSEADDPEHHGGPSNLDVIDDEGIQRLIEFFLILKRWDQKAKARGLIPPD